ncbi:MAG: hypothetical protein HY803_03725 [candidate division NC10 bacterium]|nr:hypothetical protein [candidate division NC10 bacterium]
MNDRGAVLPPTFLTTATTLPSLGVTNFSSSFDLLGVDEVGDAVAEAVLAEMPVK